MTMKKLSKTLALTMIAAALLTSCGKGAQDGGTTEIDFLLSSPAASSEQFIWNDILANQFGIKANFEMAAQSAHIEKLQLLIASNNLPDMISPMPSDTAKKIGISGMLIDYNDYMDKMPNFERISKEDKTAYVSLFADDGGLYIAPQYAKDVCNYDYFRYIPVIREDLVKETGLDMPKTYDELYEVLKAIKQKHPETVGIVNRTGADIFKDIGYTFGTRPDVCYSYEEDKYVFGPESENYKEMLKYLNKLWKENLVDPELFTASKTQVESKMVNGLGVFCMDWPLYASNYCKSHQALAGEDDFSLVPAGPVTPACYPREIIQKVESVTPYCSIVVSSKTDAPEKLVKFIDWLYSDEGSDITSYGFKDKNYTVEDGKYKFKPEIVTAYNPDGTIEKDKILGINLPHMRRITTNKEYTVSDKFDDKINAVLDEFKENGYAYPVNNGINLTYTEEEIETRSTLLGDINTCVNEWSIGFVTGAKSFDEYDTFLAEAKSRGCDTLVEINNAAYDRLKTKLAEVK